MSSGTLPERLAEREETFFDGGCDTLLVYESGEAILINHDDRIFWAKSRAHGRDAADT